MKKEFSSSCLVQRVDDFWARLSRGEVLPQSRPTPEADRKRTLRAAAILAAAIGITGVVQAGDADVLQAVEIETAATPKPSGYFSVSALALSRDLSDTGAIIAANPAGTPFLTGDDFDFGLSAGVDASFGFAVFGDEVIEARLMYSEMEAGNITVTPGNFIGAGFVGPGGVTATSEYDTTFVSGEINWRHSYNDRVTVLAGMRGFDIDDTLRTVLNNNVATGLYEAENSLLGAQIGAQMALIDGSGPLKLDLSGKVGVYSNDSNAGIRTFQGNNFIGEFQSGRVSETSYAAELGLTLGYRLTDRTELTAGYHLLWMDDIAMAGSAASGSLLNPNLLRTNVFRDEMLLQGFSIGVRTSF